MAYVKAHYNRIVFRFRIDGQQKSTTVELKPTKSNLQSAKRQAERAESRLKAGEPWESVRADLRGENITVAQTLGYYAQYLLDHADVQLSTIMGYESAYNQYWKVFDHRAIDSLIKSELQKHLAKVAKDKSKKTRTNALSVLRQIFDIAKDDGVITTAPTDRWEIKKEQKPEPDPYTEKERDEVLSNLIYWPIAHDYFLMAFHTGMRTGELLGLEWDGIQKPYISVHQSRVRRKIKGTKTNSARRVIVPDPVWDMLDANPTRFRRSFVFLTPEGHPFIDADWLMDRWSRAHKTSNVRRRTGPYPWRSTYISLALAGGSSLIWVSKQAGHNMITMQSNYGRWIQGRESADLEELNKVYK